MFSYKYFFIILGFSVCILSSASEHKETTKQKVIDPKLENKWNEKFHSLNERIDTMETNQLTGSSAIDEIKANFTKLMNMFEQVFKKLEENSKKIENIEDNFSEKLDNSKIIENNSRKIETLNEKIDKKLNDTADEVMIEFRSKCRAMCEVKGHSLINQTKAEVEHHLEHLEYCLTEDKQKVLNVCSPNPCNGGQCMLNATGSRYFCSNCPNVTFGSHCQKSKCDKENKCMKYRNTLYFVFESELEWEEANRKCVAEGMTMAMPKDQYSTKFLVGMLRDIYGYDDSMEYVWFWLGLKKDAIGEWRWTDGSPLEDYTGGESNFKRYTNQRCALMYLHGKHLMWFPNPCNSLCYPLCEKHILVN